MDRARRERRTPRRMVSILSVSALVVGMLAVLAPGAGAAGVKTCWVKNITLAKSYGPATGSVLQTAINAAGSGNTLEVRGRCVGNFYIDKNLTLVGKAKDNYPVATLDGNGLVGPPVLYVQSGATTDVTDLTITGGLSRGVWVNEGTLTLSGSSSVSGNKASGDGGGIVNTGTLTLSGSSSVSGNNASNLGGGILNTGTLTLSGSSSVSGNKANVDGGGIFGGLTGTVTMNGSSSVHDNTADADGDGSGAGGGIFNRGTMTITDSTVSGNVAVQGGGILNFVANTSRMTITNSTVTDNDATLTVATAAAGGGIYNSNGTMTITNSTVSSNHAGSQGGGIANTSRMTITNSTVSDNTAGGLRGGGIRNTGLLALTDTTVSGNEVSGTTAESGGGGIETSSVLGFSNSRLILAGTTSITSNAAHTSVGGGGGISCLFNVCTVKAADGSTDRDPVSQAILPAWTGSVSGNTSDNPTAGSSDNCAPDELGGQLPGCV